MALQIFIALIGLVFLILSALPLFYHINHIGMWIGGFVGAFLLSYSLLLPVLQKSSFGTIVSHIWLGMILVGLLTFLILSAIQFFDFSRYQAPYKNQTVVVLGCKVRGNQPTKMLRYRLDAAYEILASNQTAVCIVSGGQGEDESYPEAEIMANYLSSRGINRSRIYEENKSRTTLENLQFSNTLIESEQLSTDVILVTDFYHQYRSCLYARKIGLSPQAESGYTNPALVFSYWVRETLAVVKAWFIL